jgi:lysophospholipase L1-like esterase
MRSRAADSTVFRRIRPRWLITFLLLALSLIASCTSFFSPQPQADPNPARFAEDIRRFVRWDRQNSYPDNAILFVGSSTILLWRTHEYFPEYPVINRGFGGSQISDVAYYADRVVLNYKPKVIVFYAGENDIAAKKTPQQVFEDYQAFVDLVRRHLPETKIIFLSIKPNPERWRLWPLMQQTNALVAAFSAGHEHLIYVDVATPLLGANGQPRPELFEDRLHLNEAGFQVVSETLRPYLAESMAED